MIVTPRPSRALVDLKVIKPTGDTLSVRRAINFFIENLARCVARSCVAAVAVANEAVASVAAAANVAVAAEAIARSASNPPFVRKCALMPYQGGAGTGTGTS